MHMEKMDRSPNNVKMFHKRVDALEDRIVTANKCNKRQKLKYFRNKKCYYKKMKGVI